MNNVDIRDKDQCIYTVEVQQGGNLIASYTVEAPDALAAINRVELLYGQPVTVEKTAIEDQEGDKHRFTLAHNIMDPKNWTGKTRKKGPIIAR